jgi:hypothetical protein
MIIVSDQEYQEAHVRRLKRLLCAVAVAAVAGGAIGAVHELRIRHEFQAVPAVVPGNVSSIDQRVAGIDALLRDEPLWLGSGRAERERRQLVVERERLAAEQDRIAQQQAAEGTLEAEAARLLARKLVAAGDHAGAVEQCELALASAPEDWEHREQVEQDLAALQTRTARR